MITSRSLASCRLSQLTSFSRLTAQTGKDQLDQAIEKVKLSSSESELKFIDTVQTLGSGLAPAILSSDILYS
jgi:hypothetical protein